MFYLFRPVYVLSNFVFPIPKILLLFVGLDIVLCLAPLIIALISVLFIRLLEIRKNDGNEVQSNLAAAMAEQIARKKEFYETAKFRKFLISFDYVLLEQFAKKYTADFQISEEQLRDLVSFRQQYLSSEDFINDKNGLTGQGYDYYLKNLAELVKIMSLDDDVRKLQTILQTRNWHFTTQELFVLVNRASCKMFFENTKARILLSPSNNQKEVIDAYLDSYQCQDHKTLSVLLEILKERELFKGNLTELSGLVEKVKKIIEIERFEQQLTTDDRQIQLKDIDQLGGYEFEEFLKNLYSKMGYQVEQTKLSGDQGADLVVIKFGEKTVIQAKRYSGNVGNYAVQEIMAAISLYNAQKGMVITNNYFTPAAVELANANNIELIDRDGLEELINKYW